MSRPRITEEFVKLLRLLVDKTGGNPENLKGAFSRFPELGPTVTTLYTYWRRLEDHRKTAQKRYIPQAHPEFYSALSVYEAVWKDSWIQHMDWDGERRGEPPLLSDIDFELPASDLVIGDSEDNDWYFDSEEHSASAEFDTALENLRSKVDEYPHFSRAAGAWEWFEKTVGVNLKQIEMRWRQIPITPVKDSVSNQHGLDENRSLYAYLDNIRLAYVAGADLAALSMCRSVTEILIRFHFFDSDNKTHLAELLKELNILQPELSRLNLADKVEQANKLMHFNTAYPADRWNDVQVAVRNWFPAINELINAAPPSPHKKTNSKVLLV